MKRVLIAAFLWQAAVLAVEDARIGELILLESAVLESMCRDLAWALEIPPEFMETSFEGWRKLSDRKIQLARNVLQYEGAKNERLEKGQLPWQKDPDAMES